MTGSSSFSLPCFQPQEPLIEKLLRRRRKMEVRNLGKVISLRAVLGKIHSASAAMMAKARSFAL